MARRRNGGPRRTRPRTGETRSVPVISQVLDYASAVVWATGFVGWILLEGAMGRAAPPVARGLARLRRGEPRAGPP